MIACFSYSDTDPLYDGKKIEAIKDIPSYSSQR